MLAIVTKKPRWQADEDDGGCHRPPKGYMRSAVKMTFVPFGLHRSDGGRCRLDNYDGHDEEPNEMETGHPL